MVEKNRVGREGKGTKLIQHLLLSSYKVSNIFNGGGSQAASCSRALLSLQQFSRSEINANN